MCRNPPCRPESQRGNPTDALLRRGCAAQAAMSHRQGSKWLVIGHYGGNNTGDEAMLWGLVHGVGLDLSRRLVIATRAKTPIVASDGRPVELVPATPRHILKALLVSRGVVLGGGSHFQDAYKGARYVRHVRYLARFIAIFLLARLLRKRVLLLAMGFGPFLRRPTAWMTKLALHLSHHVTVRDTKSYQEVGTWVGAEKLSLAFDLAALAPIAPAARSSVPPAGSMILGVSVTSVSHNDASGSEIDSVFEQRLTAALATVLRQESGVQIRIFVIRGGHREADTDKSQRLCDALLAVSPTRVHLVPYNPDPSLTFHKISECHAFLAMRFHSAILAYLAGCRLLLCAYHRKVGDLAQDLGLSGEACIDVFDEKSVLALESRLRRLVNDADDYAAQLSIADAVRRAAVSIDALRSHS